MVHGNCRLGWSRCFPMSAAYTPVMCRYTHLHVSVYIYTYIIYTKLYRTPPKTYLFVFFTGICRKLCTFWAYIFGCSFGSCFGWLVGGAIYNIYIYIYIYNRFTKGLLKISLWSIYWYIKVYGIYNEAIFTVD